jgi:tetratricopeptide (TPR) repeat protein
MSIEQIAAQVTESIDILTTRLHDVPDRQRSLRVIYDDTVAQLESAEKHSLHALSIFTGGCTAEAAHQIADASPMVLDGLVKRGLLTITDKGRYQMHELTRQYAAETRPEVIAERHASYFARLLQASHADFHGPNQHDVLIDLVDDIDSIRHAWQYAIAHYRTDLLFAMVDTLAEIYLAQPRLAEGGQPLRAALSILSADQSEDLELSATIAQYLAQIQFTLGDMDGQLSARMALDQATRIQLPQIAAWAHVRLCFFDVVGGKFDEASAHAHQAMTHFTGQDDPKGLAAAMNVLGAAHAFQGQHDEAAHWFRSAIELARAAGDIWWMMGAFINLAVHYINVGRFKEAQTLLIDLEDRATVARYTQNKGVVAIAVGQTYEALGDNERAHEHYLRGYTTCLEQADRYNVAVALSWLSRAKRFLGDLTGSMRCAREATQTLRHIAPRSATLSLRNQGETARAMGSRDEARRYFDESVALAHETNAPDAIIASAGYLAEMAVEEGDLNTAQQWLEAALEIEANVQQVYLKYLFLVRCAAYHLAGGAPEQALLLLAFVRAHPNAPYEARRLAQDRWEARRTVLSPNEQDSVLAQANALTLETALAHCPQKNA